MAAARNELPRLRSARRHSQASKQSERSESIRKEIELIQAILRPYTVLEYAELGNNDSLLVLLQAIHHGIERYAENPARIPDALRLPYWREALADLKRRIEGLRSSETGEPDPGKRARADDEAQRTSSPHHAPPLKRIGQFDAPHVNGYARHR